MSDTSTTRGAAVARSDSGAATGNGSTNGSPASGVAALLGRWRHERWWPLALLGAMYLGLTILARVTDGRSLTSEGTFNSMLILGSPILLAGLGGLFSERSGIINIGLEGMMVMGTWGAAFMGWKYGAWWAILGGVLGGMCGSLIMILTTVVVGVDHVVSGVALNILAPGLGRYLSSKYFVGHGGSISSSPQLKGASSTGKLRLPVFTGGKVFGAKTPDVLGAIEKRNWFFVSEVAGALRGMLADVPWSVVLAVALVPLSTFVLWRTRFGLRLRSSGENPFAANSLGVAVHRMQAIALLIAGALAGLGGAIMVVESARQYREGQTVGTGFIGLAALIFGNYRPTGIAAGAGLFGYASGISSRDLFGKGTRALVLLLAIVLAVIAITLIRRRARVAAVASALLAIGVYIWFHQIAKVPSDLVNLVAPIVTLVVLTVGGRRLRPPRFEGLPWRKGMQI